MKQLLSSWWNWFIHYEKFPFIMLLLLFIMAGMVEVAFQTARKAWRSIFNHSE